MISEQEKIGKYELVGEIASGGMGVVYQAYDPFLDRFVALKIPKLHTDTSPNSDFERLFYNETHAASILHHPNIIEMYDAGVADGQHYIALEYIPGGVTLRRFCNPDNLLPVDLIGQMIIKAAEAFDYAHRRGIMHRDIKPSNIMLKGDREVKIADFGLAMLLDPDLVDTQSISVMGSPKYMAPERINEEASTHASDVYSLGVVMYQLLVGRPPFVAENLAALTKLILTTTPDLPSSVRPNLPHCVDDIVMRAIAKVPGDRFATMHDFASAISECLDTMHGPVDGAAVELRTEQLRRISFFEEFSDTDLWELLRWATWIEVADGDTVIREGDFDNSVYVIISGRMRVLKGDNQIAVLSKDEVFGEIAFLTERKRTASVVARGNATLLQVTMKQIEHTSQTCQIQFQRRFIATLIDRLVKTTEQLSQMYSASGE